MQESWNLDIALSTIEEIKEFRKKSIRVSNKMRNGRDCTIWRMDVCASFFCGCLLLAGGMIALLASVYSCFTYVNGSLIVTEVLLSGCVVLLGLYLMLRSLPKVVGAVTAEKDCESPFYYELEPIAVQKSDFAERLDLQNLYAEPIAAKERFALLQQIALQQRELPPIPKDIGHKYDAIILDRV